MRPCSTPYSACSGKPLAASLSGSGATVTDGCGRPDSCAAPMPSMPWNASRMSFSASARFASATVSSNVSVTQLTGIIDVFSWIT